MRNLHIGRWLGCCAVLVFLGGYVATCRATDEQAAAAECGHAGCCSECNGDCSCAAHCCDCDCCCGELHRCLGMLPSDHCFDRFISPLSNPFYFEDPRSLTEVRGIFLDNTIPNSIQGGNADVWALALRGRITENLSVIVPRIGYLQVNQPFGSSNGLLSSPVGLKYNIISDPDRQFVLAGGVTYFITGSQDASSAWGDGDFHFFLTGGKEIFGNGHWLSATGFRIPADSFFGTQMWYWSNQWDYELPGHIYPLFGVNWFHWMRSAGANLPIPVTGLDLIDLPTGGVAGTDVVTSVVGVKWKPSCNVEVGTGYEFPLTERTDVLQGRVYADLIFRY